MKKYLYLCSLFFTLALQPAYAQKYEYTGHTPPTYININGEQYVRIPHNNQKPSPKYETYSSQISKNNISSKHYTLSLSTKLKPYIGLDINYNKNKIKITNNGLHSERSTENFKEELVPPSTTKINIKNNISGIIGLRLSSTLSFEAFYQKSNANKNTLKKETIKSKIFTHNITYKNLTKIDYESYGIDAIYSKPFFNQQFELLLALGIGIYDISTKSNNSVRTKCEGNPLFTAPNYDITFNSPLSLSNQSIGYRFGIGGQYNFNDHLSLRTMLRYIKLSDDKLIDNMIEFSTGLRYYF